MDSRERLAAIVREARKINTTLFADKGEGPKELLAKMGEMSVAQITDAILSSDWLRDTLAAERERCAKVAERVGQDFLSPEYAFPQPIGSIQERFACAQVAAAIRGDAK